MCTGIIVYLVHRYSGGNARLESGVESIEDEASPGRPFSVRNEGLISKVYITFRFDIPYVGHSGYAV